MRTIHRHIHRLLDAYRLLGFKKMLWIIPRWQVRREYLMGAIDLHLPLPDVPVHESIYWRPLKEAEIPQVQAMDPQMYEGEIRRRWGEGQECLLYWIEGSLVHYRWFSTLPAYLPSLGKTLRPLEGDFLSLTAFTHPAFRGRGIASLSFIRTLHHARDQGLTRGVGIVPWWNVPSIRAHWEKTGRTLAGTVGYWNVGLRKIHFTTGDVSLDESGNVFVPR